MNFVFRCVEGVNKQCLNLSPLCGDVKVEGPLCPANNPGKHLLAQNILVDVGLDFSDDSVDE